MRSLPKPNSFSENAYPKFCGCRFTAYLRTKGNRLPARRKAIPYKVVVRLFLGSEAGAELPDYWYRRIVAIPVKPASSKIKEVGSGTTVEGTTVVIAWP